MVIQQLDDACSLKAFLHLRTRSGSGGPNWSEWSKYLPPGGPSRGSGHNQWKSRLFHLKVAASMQCCGAADAV
jgi:hypothetical protein